MSVGAERKGGGQPRETSKRPSARPARKRRRWRLLSTLAVLAIIVWSLPMIVANTPLLPWIVKQATANLNGTATVQSASLGWFSPVGATGIKIKDKDGKSVVSVASVNGDRPLAAILCDYTNLGTFHLYGTQVSAVLRDNGSNVEDMLANYLAQRRKRSSRKRRPRSRLGWTWSTPAYRWPTNSRAGNGKSASSR